MSKKEKKDKKPIWRKTSTGTLILREPTYLRIKPKQEVEASKKELGKFWDTDFELLENGTGKYFVDVDAEEEVIAEAPAEEYTVESAGGGWFNVVSPGGKVMNEKKLRAPKAEELKAQLEAEQTE